MSDIKVTNHILLDMRSVVLIEIRAHSNPKYGKTMSDIFHNVPVRIIRNVPPTEIYEDMMRVAKRHSVEEYLTKLLNHSFKKFGSEDKAGEEE